MHSSRMRTAPLLTVSQHALLEVYLPGGCTCQGCTCLKACTCQGGCTCLGVYLPGVYLPMGCTCPGEVYLPGGVPARGVPAQGVYLPGGCTCQGVYLPGGVPAWGGYLPRYSPSVNRMTDRCKNITYPRLRLRAVIMQKLRLRAVIMQKCVLGVFEPLFGHGLNTEVAQNYLESCRNEFCMVFSSFDFFAYGPKEVQEISQCSPYVHIFFFPHWIPRYYVNHDPLYEF